MFLELTVKDIEKGELGYILGKHPESSFETRLSRGRIVLGRWKEGETAYSVSVQASGVEFLKVLRNLNLSNYVHAQQSVVCPFSLACIRAALGSLLSAKYHVDSTRHDDAFVCSAVIGPWSAAEPSQPWPFAPLGLVPTTIGKHMLRLESDRPMPVAEFVQKLYTGAHLATQHMHLGPEIEWRDKLKTFARFAESWPEHTDPPALGQRVSKALGWVTGAAGPQPATPTSTHNSLHKIRHALIMEWVGEEAVVGTTIDYGCGSGSLALAVAKAHDVRFVFAVDALGPIERCKRFNVTPVRTNLLYPRALLHEVGDLAIDVLLLSEVIEHMEAVDRERLVAIVAHVLRPRRIAITTPNREYNEQLGDALCWNGMRHTDHRIEYCPDDWQREVVQPLAAAGYAC